MDSDSDSDTLDEETKYLLNSVFADTDEDEEDFEGFKDDDVCFSVTKNELNVCSSSPMDIEESQSSEPMFSSANESSDDENQYGLQEIMRIFESSDDESTYDFEGFTEDDLDNFKPESSLVTIKTESEESTFSTLEDNASKSCQMSENMEPKLPAVNDNCSTQQTNRRPQSDFDIMMKNRKKIRDSNKKTSRNIVECEDVIYDVIDQMKAAAEDDKNLQKQKKIATKKLKTLPIILPQLKKEDLKVHFCDMGLLDVFADWLMPTSDNILPHLSIRNALIRQLLDFTCINKDHLRRSRIALVLRRLVKHEKETRYNKEKLRQLLSSWSRSVFNVKDNYHSLTEFEREDIVKYKNNNGRSKQENKILQEPTYYYMPGYQIPKKSKETFEKMLAKPERTKAFKEKLKRFEISKYYKY